LPGSGGELLFGRNPFQQIPQWHRRQPDDTFSRSDFCFDEALNAHLFSTLDQVREITKEWMKIYNEYRPHDALGRMPPAMFMRKLKLENSNYEQST